MSAMLKIYPASASQIALVPPYKATPGAAGYDLASTRTDVLYYGERRIIPTGFIWHIPEGYVGLIRDRSSLASRGIVTTAGVIDSDYRGEVKVLLTNQAEAPFEIRPGDRIAQLLVLPIYSGSVAYSAYSPHASLGTTRGDGGFGSTGVA